MWHYLFNTKKIGYVKGDKPKVPCILCAIRDREPTVTNLEIHRTDHFIITVNLYPFNPGHVMIFPAKHLDDIRDLQEHEVIEMHRLVSDTISVINEEFNPSGYNIGFNMGRGSGESISHIHQHIIPRYGNEVGFVDLIAGTRLFVTDPLVVMEHLKARFKERYAKDRS